MSSSESEDQLDWELPATLKNVELVCSDVREILEKYSLQSKDRFATELLLREALNNAVLHGCHQNPLLSFSCRLMISNQEAIIEVSNNGAGFDWRRKPEILPANSDESGRGLSIYAIYANSINFDETGNSVNLTRIFNKESKMSELQVTQTGAQATIILGEKLAASEVPTLKNEMKRLIEAGVTSMSLDCTQLNMMDSTGIGCLVAAHNSLTKLNGSLSITHVSSDINDLLCSMRLDRRIKITPLVTAQE